MTEDLPVVEIKTIDGAIYRHQYTDWTVASGVVIIEHGDGFFSYYAAGQWTYVTDDFEGII